MSKTFRFSGRGRKGIPRLYFKTALKKGFLKNNLRLKRRFAAKRVILRAFLKKMEIPDALRQLLRTPQQVAIFSHRNPDGDAIGSSLAMLHYLVQHGHSVHIIFPSDFPEEFEILPGADDILIWDQQPEECKQVINRKNLFIFLDFNALERIDKVGDYIRNLPAARVMIDHHLFPEPVAEYAFSEPSASSTCEMVYRFIESMGDLDKIRPDTVGRCIYTGIVTDTGSFRHATNPAAFRISADLVERGTPDTAVQDMIFNSQKEKNLRLLGHCLTHRMEFFPEYKTALIWLSRKDYEQFDIQRGDTEGIVNYLLSVREVQLAAFIHNQPTVVKLSLRSKGNIDVQEICKKHFKGGGHKNAAGAYSHDSLKATIEKFKSILPEYKDRILAG